MKIIDITQPLFECEVYPGDRKPSYTRVRTIVADNYNLTDISLCVHNGTHIDAPRHFFKNGEGVGDLSLDVFYGKCVVGNKVTYAKRLLIKGGYVLTTDDAHQLVKWRVKLIGVEGQSVSDAMSQIEVHKILLSAGIIPLEGLRLAGVACGEYMLSALPLNLGVDCDGSPVRAILITDDNDID
jgi:arylformamidase